MLESDIGKPERATQNRVIKLFVDELGYRYLSDWTDRDGNSNIVTYLLAPFLTRSGYQQPKPRPPDILTSRRVENARPICWNREMPRQPSASNNFGTTSHERME